MNEVDLPSDAATLVEFRRQRFYHDDAVRWVWVFYGLAQAAVTMFMAFGVIEGTTPAAVVTAVALVVYVGVNEIFVRPYRNQGGRRARKQVHEEGDDAEVEAPMGPHLPEYEEPRRKSG